ncbi:MAG: Anti-sigma-B factor antagonist [Planctomycetes bacterium]|nr:Anti-sigma-B factor antagonist [Planctomycetota bacterium]
MDLSLRKIGNTLVVGFAARVNLEGDSSLVFKEKLKALIAGGYVHVVMDLGNVGFIDSQGLGTLISCLKVLRQADGNLTLTNLSESVEAVLRITRLIRVFDVLPTVDDALAAAAARPQSAATPAHGAWTGGANA